MNCTKNPRYSSCMVHVWFMYGSSKFQIQSMYSSCIVQVKCLYSSIRLLCKLIYGITILNIKKEAMKKNQMYQNRKKYFLHQYYDKSTIQINSSIWNGEEHKHRSDHWWPFRKIRQQYQRQYWKRKRIRNSVWEYK